MLVHFEGDIEVEEQNYTLLCDALEKCMDAYGGGDLTITYDDEEESDDEADD